MSVPVNCKVVLVGDNNVGKTELLMVYVHNKYPQDYVPTVFDNFDQTVNYKGKIVRLSLWDTAGQEEYDKLRYLSYPNSNVFVLMYAVDNIDSFKAIKDKWLPEITKFAPRVPFILVCSYTSRRETSVLPTVSKEMGQRLAIEIGAVAYMEVSQREMTGVREVIDKAIEIKLGMCKEQESKLRRKSFGGSFGTGIKGLFGALTSAPQDHRIELSPPPAASSSSSASRKEKPPLSPSSPQQPKPSVTVVTMPLNLGDDEEPSASSSQDKPKYKIMTMVEHQNRRKRFNFTAFECSSASTVCTAIYAAFDLNPANHYIEYFDETFQEYVDLDSLEFVPAVARMRIRQTDVPSSL